MDEAATRKCWSGQMVTMTAFGEPPLAAALFLSSVM
jgi:hypothetical protein